MQGLLRVAANATKLKNVNRFKRWMTIQLYVQTNFHGQLKMTANKKAATSPVLAAGFKKILLVPDLQLPRQAENDSIRMEQFRRFM